MKIKVLFGNIKFQKLHLVQLMERYQKQIQSSKPKAIYLKGQLKKSIYDLTDFQFFFQRTFFYAHSVFSSNIGAPNGDGGM